MTGTVRSSGGGFAWSPGQQTRPAVRWQAGLTETTRLPAAIPPANGKAVRPQRQCLPGIGWHPPGVDGSTSPRQARPSGSAGFPPRQDRPPVTTGLPAFGENPPEAPGIPQPPPAGIRVSERGRELLLAGLKRPSWLRCLNTKEETPPGTGASGGVQQDGISGRDCCGFQQAFPRPGDGQARGNRPAGSRRERGGQKLYMRLRVAENPRRTPM